VAYGDSSGARYGASEKENEKERKKTAMMTVNVSSLHYYSTFIIIINTVIIRCSLPWCCVSRKDLAVWDD
jgi:hypothetical protein